MNYFEDLLNINIKLTGYGDNIRCDNIKYYNDILKRFYQEDFNLANFLRICDLLFNAQIFNDGNSRTVFTYMTKVLNEHGYKINRHKLKTEKDDLRFFFPIMYDLNEILKDGEMQRMLNYIYQEPDLNTKKKHKTR